MYKLLRSVPYVILLFFAGFFLWVSKTETDLVTQTVALNLASSSLFVVIAYFFYDLAKAYIEQRESRYIADYIARHIRQDVIMLLHLLKKYIHGYNLETNTLDHIWAVSKYAQQQIRTIMSNQIHAGFLILKELEDLKGLFREVINNSLVVRYAPRDQIISLLKIISLLAKIESIFKDERNFDIYDGVDSEFLVINAKEFNPKNEAVFLLVKRVSANAEYVVYDYGYFEQQRLGELLQKFVLKKEYVDILSDKIFELIQFLRTWLPDQLPHSGYTNKYRIMENRFSMFTNTWVKNNKVYVSDIINLSIDDSGKSS